MPIPYATHRALSGEHTRLGCRWTRPRVQPLRARTLLGSWELLAPDVFREGAEKSTRGACAPHLQSAPAVTGPFTNLPAATSPHTNPLTAPQQFFRLEGN